MSINTTNKRSRAFLTGASLLVAGVVLAACANGGSSESATTSAPAEESAAATSASPAESGAPSIDPAGQSPFQMATWGGLSAKAFGKAWGGAFEKATGIAYDNSPIMDYAAWQEQIKRVKRVGFGFRSFRHYRIRTLLYAGKPNWSLLSTLPPLG